MATIRLIVALAGALQWCGCAGYWEKDWREVDTGDALFQDAWDAVVEMAARDGYPVYAGGTDQGLKVLETRWRTRSAPFRGSQRKRLHAEFERKDGSDSWLIRFYVERQKVDDMRPGFNPKEEDWESDGQDVETEDLFLYKLQLRFHGTPEPPPQRRFEPNGR